MVTVIMPMLRFVTTVSFVARMLTPVVLIVVVMIVPVSVIVFSLLCHFLNPQLFLSPLTPYLLPLTSSPPSPP